METTNESMLLTRFLEFNQAIYATVNRYSIFIEEKSRECIRFGAIRLQQLYQISIYKRISYSIQHRTTFPAIAQHA